MITNRMIDSAFRAMRRAADASGYGEWINNDYCREAGIAVLKQVDADVGITPGRPGPKPEPEPVHPDVERETAWHMFERLVAELASKFQSHPGGPPGVRPGG